MWQISLIPWERDGESNFVVPGSTLLTLRQTTCQVSYQVTEVKVAKFPLYTCIKVDHKPFIIVVLLHIVIFIPLHSKNVMKTLELMK